MRTLLVILLISSFLLAGWVNGYVKSDGTYVPGYYRSEANGIEEDNYSYTPKKYNYSYSTPKTYSYDPDDSYSYPQMKDYSTY